MNILSRLSIGVRLSLLVTASARALEEQAGELREAVAQFRLAAAEEADARRLVQRLGRQAVEPLETA